MYIYIYILVFFKPNAQWKILSLTNKVSLTALETMEL